MVFAASRAKVVLETDGNTWPYHAQVIWGTAQVDMVDEVSQEYQACAEGYFGTKQGKAWVGQVGNLFNQMARIVVTPEWVGILDFEQRFPSAIKNAMSGVAG